MSSQFVRNTILLASMACAGSALLTRYILQLAVRHRVLDIPNHRSSHAAPTPRGGGVAIVCVTVVVLLWLTLRGMLEPRMGIALGVGSTMIALIGAWDDLRSLRALPRLCIQLVAAGIVVWSIFPTLASRDLLSPFFLSATAIMLAIAMAWLTNLYNFMDGIDGIAGLEAVVSAIVATILFQDAGLPGPALLAVTLAGASAGFLIFNWSPAKIFMGDTGSGFLGFIFAGLIIIALSHSVILAIALTLPLLPFIVDATVTLLTRLHRGSLFAIVAHREHVYQLAVQRGYSHATVSLATGVLSAVLGAAAIVATREKRMFLPVASVAIIATLSLHLTLRTTFRRTSPH